MSRGASLFSTVDLSLAVLGSTLALAGSLIVGPQVGGYPLGRLLMVSAMGCGAVLGVRLIAWLMVDVVLVRRSGKEASSLVRMLTSWVLYVVALMVLLKFGLGRDIGALLTGSAVLGAVGGFALQATLDNLFTGVSLQLEQPFGIGDVVGRVEAMTWRAVHLRTEERSRVVVPNSAIGTDQVEVLQGEESSERTLEIEADPLAPPGRVVQLLTEAVAGLPNVASRPSPEVYPTILRDWLGSRVYEVQYFPERYLDWESTEALIRRRCWYRLERHGLGASARSATQGTARAVNPSRPTEREIRAGIASAGLLRALGEEALAQLAAVAEPLLYTEDERVDDLPDPGPALFVVQRGRLVVHTPDLAPGELRRPDLPDDAKLEAWSPKELEDATARLVEHLGPAAELLVRRAARRTVDPGRLQHLLAAEIDDPAHRAAFLRGVPERATHELVPGDLLGVLSVFGDARLELDLVRAATEVTLLRLPREAVLEAVRGSGGAFDRLLPALQAWRASHPAKRLVTLPSEEGLRGAIGA